MKFLLRRSSNRPLHQAGRMSDPASNERSVMPIKLFRKLRELDSVLLVMLIGSLGLNVYLGIARNRASLTNPNLRSPIAEGTRAPTFEGTTLSGVPVTIDYTREQRTTLLYVFSPTCHWCEKNLANIRAIASARPDLYLVGVNVGPPVDEKSARDQPFAEILRPTALTSRAYGFGGTPSTILISASGKVIKTWAGAYSGRTAKQVSETLAVALPGLLGEDVVRKEH